MIDDDRSQKPLQYLTLIGKIVGLRDRTDDPIRISAPQYGGRETQAQTNIPSWDQPKLSQETDSETRSRQEKGVELCSIVATINPTVQQEENADYQTCCTDRLHLVSSYSRGRSQLICIRTIYGVLRRSRGVSSCFFMLAEWAN